jgi:hypothetical protein
MRPWIKEYFNISTITWLFGDRSLSLAGGKRSKWSGTFTEEKIEDPVIKAMLLWYKCTIGTRT